MSLGVRKSRPWLRRSGCSQRRKWKLSLTIAGCLFLHVKSSYANINITSICATLQRTVLEGKASDHPPTYPQAPLLRCSSVKSPQEWADCAVWDGEAPWRPTTLQIIIYVKEQGGSVAEIRSERISMSAGSLGKIFNRWEYVRSWGWCCCGIHAAACELLQQPVALR